MGIRDGSFSHFSFYEKWEKEPSLIPIFSFPLLKKWEKEPSLIPISSPIPFNPWSYEASFITIFSNLALQPSENTPIWAPFTECMTRQLRAFTSST